MKRKNVLAKYLRLIRRMRYAGSNCRAPCQNPMLAKRRPVQVSHCGGRVVGATGGRDRGTFLVPILTYILHR